MPAQTYHLSATLADGSQPLYFLSDHGKRLGSAARAGRVSENDCKAIAALVSEEKIGVYGTQARNGTLSNFTNTLDSITKALKCAQEYTPPDNTTVPDHPDIVKFVSENNGIFGTLSANQKRSYTIKYNAWNNKIVKDGQSIGMGQYLTHWDPIQSPKEMESEMTRLAEVLRAGQPTPEAEGKEENAFGIPNDAFSVERIRKRTLDTANAETRNEGISMIEIENALVRMGIFKETDLLKNPQWPEAHPMHEQSQELRAKLEQNYLKLFNDCVNARLRFLADIAKERGESVNTFTIDKCPGKFGVFNLYCAQKLCEYRVWHHLPIVPQMIGTFANVSGDALRKLCEKLFALSQCALEKKKFIKEGTRLKTYAALEMDIAKSFNYTNDRVMRVARSTGAVLAANVWEDFDQCISHPIQRLRIDDAYTRSSASTPDEDTHSTHTHGHHTHGQTPTDDRFISKEYLDQRMNDVNGMFMSLVDANKNKPTKNNTLSGMAVSAMRKSTRRGHMAFSNEYYIDKQVDGFREIRKGVSAHRSRQAHAATYDDIVNKDMRNKDRVGSMQGLCEAIPLTIDRSFRTPI